MDLDAQSTQIKCDARSEILPKVQTLNAFFLKDEVLIISPLWELKNVHVFILVAPMLFVKCQMQY
jgi:hypothetical protein